MKQASYLFDTHALIFWHTKEGVSGKFIDVFDKHCDNGRLYVSSISFWEIALLVKRKRIEIADVRAWKNELLSNSTIQLVEPSADEMIASVTLPDNHKDPFDRLLVAQAKRNKLIFVTKDQKIKDYDIESYWPGL